MKYVFVDTDNGGSPSNATPDTSTSKYHSSSTWPANGARWSSLINALNDATVRGVTDDLTIYCQGATEEVVSSGSWNINGASWTSLLIRGNLSTAKWSTSEYRIRATGTQQAFCTHSSTVYDVTLLNLQIEHNGSSTTANVGVRCSSTSRTLKIGSCFIRMNGASTSTEIGVDGAGVGGTLLTWNTIVQGRGTISTDAGAKAFSQSIDGITMACYNCVAHNFNYGFHGNNMTIKNSAVFDTTDDFFGSQTIQYCASDDGNGTNAQTSITWANEFEDHANGDFRLKAGSTKLKDTGVSDPGSGLYSTDIAGTTRTGSWDIGAFEWVPTGLSITSVTPSSFDDGRTGIVIAGSGFGASQGSSTLTIGGQAQTVTAWSDTSITFTSVRGSVSPGNATLAITKG